MRVNITHNIVTPSAGSSSFSRIILAGGTSVCTVRRGTAMDGCKTDSVQR